MREGSVGGGRVLLAGALVSLVGFLTLTAIVTQHRFDRADRLARALVHRSHHPLLRSPMEAASFLGGPPGQVTVIVLGSAVVWRRRALLLPMVMAGAGILQFLAKWAADRPRPNLDPTGFPSAHVLSLVVLLGWIAYIVGTSEARRGWRRLGVGACVAIVCVVAFSRMYLDAHWLSDVLGGLSIGLAYLLVVLWLIIRLTSTPQDETVLRAASGGEGRAGLPVVAGTGGLAPGPLVATSGS